MAIQTVQEREREQVINRFNLENFEFTPAPQFEVPGYDRARIRGLTQQVAGPQVSALRGGLLRSLQYARSSANPNVRGLLSRQALQGYGAGLGGIMGRAGVGAREQYTQERAPLLRAAEMDWQTEANRARMLDVARLQERSTERERELSLLDQRFAPSPQVSRTIPWTDPWAGMRATDRPQVGRTAAPTGAPPGGYESMTDLTYRLLSESQQPQAGGGFAQTLESVGTPSRGRMRVGQEPWQDISAWQWPTQGV